MSLLAGIVSRRPGRAPDPAACGQLLRALSRAPGPPPHVHRDGRALLAHLDAGAFGAPGVHRDADGAVTMVAGEPLLPGTADRGEDARALHAALRTGAAAPLRASRGVFAAVQLDPAAGVLRIASDRLGVRPVYLWIGDEWIVFASQLRVLEAISLVPRVMDPRGAVEAAAIGIPLGRRTVYADVERIAGGTLIEAGDASVRRTAYWRWDTLPPRAEAGDALVAEVDARFRDAVALRQRTDRGARAFLSGGMDSRAIVACLSDGGAAVHTFNFSLPGMQDTVFAEGFARAAGTLHRHHLLRMAMGGAKFADTLARAWAESPLRETHPVERPALAWSGDGGSVGIGHVYLTPEVVRRMRAGDGPGAVDAFLAAVAAGITPRILHPAAADALRAIPRLGVLEELAGLRCADPARAFHLFLMRNDQRRHLDAHFEHLDLHGVELQLPFFDGALLELVLATPVDAFMGHDLYTRWFHRLPACVRAVPWQTYPGHVPCPLPVPPSLGWQWDRRAFRGLRALRRARMVRAAAAMLASPGFPAPLLRRAPLALAAAVYATGVRDYAYVLRPALELHRAWRACGGRMAPLAASAGEAPAPRAAAAVEAA